MKAVQAVWLTTIYLITFYILLYTDASLPLTMAVYFSIPIVVLAMVYFVLTDHSVKPKKLGNEEWGYCDKKKEDLGIV
jgi:hypothetical protein